MSRILKMGRFFIIICLSLLPACNKMILLASPTPEPLSAWITTWLYKPSCEPPCWENLKPGETDITDSPGTLSHVPGVRITTYPSDSQTAPYNQVMWNFPNPGEGGAATTEREGQKISTIRLMVSANQYLSVKQVTGSYGYPSDILLYDCRGEIAGNSCVVHLIYKNKGLALELLLPDVGQNDHLVKLIEDSKVLAIWFFALGETSYGETIGKNSADFPKGMVQWKGYGEYP